MNPAGRHLLKAYKCACVQHLCVYVHAKNWSVDRRLRYKQISTSGSIGCSSELKVAVMHGLWKYTSCTLHTSVNVCTCLYGEFSSSSEQQLLWFVIIKCKWTQLVCTPIGLLAVCCINQLNSQTYICCNNLIHNYIHTLFTFKFFHIAPIDQHPPLKSTQSIIYI